MSTEQHVTPSEQADSFSKDHQTYFNKSAEKVNSTLHAAFCKACQAHSECTEDNRTCLWQGRDCIRHLARCPHVSAPVRAHFKEEARVLNARLSNRKRPYQETVEKSEDAPPDEVHGVPDVSADVAIANLQAQLQIHSNALARLQSLLDRHDRLACQAVVMTATNKLDAKIQTPASSVPSSSLAEDVAGLARSRLQDVQETRQSHAQPCTPAALCGLPHDFTRQEMADAVARRQGSDALAYQRLFQFAFSG